MALCRAVCEKLSPGATFQKAAAFGSGLVRSSSTHSVKPSARLQSSVFLLICLLSDHRFGHETRGFLRPRVVCAEYAVRVHGDFLNFMLFILGPLPTTRSDAVIDGWPRCSKSGLDGLGWYSSIYFFCFAAFAASADSEPHSATRKFAVQESQGESLNLQLEREFAIETLQLRRAWVGTDVFEHRITTLPFLNNYAFFI